MNQTHGSVCVATLGGQPQVVTLALDRLLARGEHIDEVIVVHLAPHNERYRKALKCLQYEFAGDRYVGKPCRYRPVSIRLRSQPINDLSSEQAIDAARNTFHTLFGQLKQHDVTIHLCVSGGRRLLGILALAMAQLHFDYADRIWHLYSPDEVRRQTHCGSVMHLPNHPDVLLVNVPMLPSSHFIAPYLTTQTSASSAFEQQQQILDVSERTRCQQVVEALTPRQCAVLRAFAQGLNPQEVANQLHIAISTVDSHKTTIFEECINAWNLSSDRRLQYYFLREKFAAFFGV
ncbi:MAG: CRISPR-associated protein [Chloroflexi bacterium AL-W]|nr:CRISPR-associated protein [Chloroflexi bacterium AL-N1]NOK66636.1 CRISPR-associated protein [Chloroflexi bacterium AL-N10]NOK72024.1 CRISPR-associated protein [Chloroflexi bacterium AL-N5]NOK81281.1 CRISPR-associated protein [Chloroflexi bacterium AL-W]NOK89554.1 CRISPR-associated protein [Chloroflexi bacterium AL-N15]